MARSYERALSRALDSCAVLIAVIGPRWLTVTDDAGSRRLDDPQDWVRVEIARALARGIRVIPVVIAATVPPEADVPADLRPLFKRQALELSDRHWRQGLAGLAQALEKIPGIARRVAAPVVIQQVGARRKMLLAALSVIVLGALAFAGWESRDLVLPRAPVDLSPWVRIRNSGPESTVAGLAVVTAMEASLARQGRPVTLSARYLYEKAKRMDRYGSSAEGTDMSAALYIAETFGAPPEDRWPYVAGSRDLPAGATWEAMDEAADKFRAGQFRLTDQAEIPKQLAQGRTVVAEVEVTNGWSSDEASRTGRIRLRRERRAPALSRRCDRRIRTRPTPRSSSPTPGVSAGATTASAICQRRTRSGP